MVRLRSRRWYSSENQDRIGHRASANSGGNRRLVSLVILLALVILVIQKARDPKYVRQAFETLGVPLDRKVIATSQPRSDDDTAPAESTEVSSTSPPANTRSADAPLDDSTSNFWRSTCEDLVPRILKDTSPGQINALAKCWFTSQPLRNDSTDLRNWLEESADRTLEEARTRVTSAAHEDSATSNSTSWLLQLDQFAENWRTLMSMLDQQILTDSPQKQLLGDNQALELSVTFREAITTHLDRRLIDLMRDAAPWNNSEQVSFWRMLQRGKGYVLSDRVDPPAISTRQLDGQPTEYRGRWIRLRGSVRRVDLVERSQPAFNIDRYWLLWLRGADGLNQPVAVYATQPLAETLASEVAKGLYPDIEVLGLVGKRLAYGAQSGVEIAPTLFATSIIHFAPNQAEQPSIGAAGAADQAKLAGLLALGAVLLAVAWIWLKLSARQRAVKRSSIRSPLLLGLALATFPQSNTQAQQAAPPWAESEKSIDDLRQIAQRRLIGVFSPEHQTEFQPLFGGQPTAIPDVILRTLFAIGQIGWQRLGDLNHTFSAGNGWRLAPLELEGWARLAQPIALTEAQQEWFSLESTPNVYRLTVEALQTVGAEPSPEGSPESQIQVLCLSIPRSWQASSQLNQPVRIRGFALEHDDASETITETNSETVATAIPKFFCVLAESPRWVFGNRQLEEGDKKLLPEISPAWTELASAGWDLAWFDLLENLSQRGLTEAETEPFLKMLDITIRSPSTSAVMNTQPVETMRQPIAHIGNPIDWKIRLVTGSLVELKSSPSKGQPAAVDRYYQYDGFVKIPGQKISYVVPGVDGKLSFEGEFPVTVLMAAESEFTRTKDLRSDLTTWKIGQHARVQGRFYRLWSYHSQRLSTNSRSIRQVAPIVMASSLQPAPPDRIDSGPVGWFGYALVIAVLVILSGILVSVFRQTFRSSAQMKLRR